MNFYKRIKPRSNIWKFKTIAIENIHFLTRNIWYVSYTSFYVHFVFPRHITSLICILGYLSWYVWFRPFKSYCIVIIIKNIPTYSLSWQSTIKRPQIVFIIRATVSTIVLITRVIISIYYPRTTYKRWVEKLYIYDICQLLKRLRKCKKQNKNPYCYGIELLRFWTIGQRFFYDRINTGVYLRAQRLHDVDN